MVTARIEKDIKGTGLWIIVEHDNQDENTQIAISEDEVIPIFDAIKDWMTNDPRNQFHPFARDLEKL